MKKRKPNLKDYDPPTTLQPSLAPEKKLWRKGYKRVACLDEAGRGPLAGPVVAAAVTISSNLKAQSSKPQLKTKNLLKEIRDSKKLSSKKREEFYKIITNQPAIKWGIGVASERMIDKINILEATKLAMQKAILNLERKLQKISDRGKFVKLKKIDFLILDGIIKLNLPISQKSIIKADEKVFSCACASILAKVTRDKIMVRYHKKYPQYGFDKHKGYPTKKHLAMLKKYGPCQIHRKSFKPVIKFKVQSLKRKIIT